LTLLFYILLLLPLSRLGPLCASRSLEGLFLSVWRKKGALPLLPSEEGRVRQKEKLTSGILKEATEGKGTWAFRKRMQLRKKLLGEIKPADIYWIGRTR